jgi:hypothetical protein
VTPSGSGCPASRAQSGTRESTRGRYGGRSTGEVPMAPVPPGRQATSQLCKVLAERPRNVRWSFCLRCGRPAATGDKSQRPDGALSGRHYTDRPTAVGDRERWRPTFTGPLLLLAHKRPPERSGQRMPAATLSRIGMLNRTGISAPNALTRGRGSLVSFLHVELVVVAGTSLG